MIVVHYSPLTLIAGGKRVYDTNNSSEIVPLTKDEREAREFLRDVDGTNVDEDTYDACFKSILHFIREQTEKSL